MIKGMKSFTLILILTLGLNACIANQTSFPPIYSTPSQQMTPTLISATKTQSLIGTDVSPTVTKDLLSLDPRERLAFSANIPLESGIYTFSPLTDKPKLVTELIDGKTFYSSPSWSSDGEQIAFTLDDASGSKIYIVKNGETKSRLLTQAPSEQHDPTWSPDGKQIVFASKSDLYIVNSDSSNLHVLASDIKPLFPAWSPDGNNIAFLSFNGDDGKDFQLNIIDKDGKNLRTPTNKTGSYSRISWSPDSSKIVFGVVEPCWDLAILDVSTSEIVQLTNSPNLERDPAWSPDGTIIAYASAPFTTCQPIPFRNAINGPFDIYIMSNNGEQTRRLTFFSEGASQPAWLPVVVP